MKVLGLDIGINSIGFALVDTEAQTILSTGVHLFDKAENPKDGASLALPRRLARGQRRVIRRRAQRKAQIRQLLLDEGLPVSFTSPEEGFEKSPWQLRAEGLQRRLTPEEWARVLYHLAKRRGFQSNRKDTDGNNDEESKKMLGAANALAQAMKANDCQTIGAYLATQDKQRNGDGDYSHTVLRDLIREETRLLFEAQRERQNDLATEALQARFTDIAFYQRPLRSSEDKVGKCALEPGERRAPKCARSAELFILWQKLNHLRLDLTNGEEKPLTPAQRQAVFEKCHEIKTVNHSHLREIIGDLLIDGEIVQYRFKGLLYSDRGKKRKKSETEEPLSFEEMIKASEDKKFVDLPGFHAMKAAFGIDKHNFRGKLPDIDVTQWDRIASILTYEHDHDRAYARLMGECQPLNAEQLDALTAISSFKGTVGHSAKAIMRLLPHLEGGLSYDKARVEAGYGFNERTPGAHAKLPPFDHTRNPVVDRALAQCRKVINAVIRRYGMPDAVHVELARDVGKSWDERRELTQKNEENRARNDALKAEAAQQGVDWMKLRLWREQGGFCMYSGKYIEPERLKDALYTEIDHILPHSRTFDDSYMNKTLCLRDENQNKTGKTPWEYLGANDDAWLQLEAHVSRLPFPKRRRFLIKNFDLSQEDAWKERHLCDTRYMARMLKNHIEHTLDFSASPIEKKRRVMTISGSITAFLRYQWGLHKNREENARHHAQDALVIACASQGMVQKVTNFEKYPGRHWHLEIPKPWPTFREDVIHAIEGVFVSRMPNRKMSGELHAQTILAKRTADNGQPIAIKRVKLGSLSPAALEKLVDKPRNIALYHTLKKRLDEHNGKPEKAFKAPIYMPTKTGAQGPRIHAVRILDDAKSGIELLRGNKGERWAKPGLAGNGDMLRVDVFEKGGKFYLCPVYTWHAYHGILPNQVIKAHIPENEWPSVDEKFNFIFSLYKNDLIRVTDKNGEKWGYYVSTDRANGAVCFIEHDQTDSRSAYRTGVQNLKLFEKYVVNCFGEKFRVNKEVRRELANPARSKPRLADPPAESTGMPTGEP